MALYKKGQSGNPSGRPKGVRDRRSQYRDALQSHAPEIIAMLLKKALDGDSVAIRIVADRICPPLKATDEPVYIELTGSPTEKGEKVISALANGSLTPGEASTAMAVIQAQTRVVSADELEARVKKLEDMKNG